MLSPLPSLVSAQGMGSSPSPDEILRQQLTAQYQTVVIQQAAAAAEALQTTDPIVTVQLEQRSNQLFQQLQGIDLQLRQLDSRSNTNPNQQAIASVESQLSSINFSKAKEIFDEIANPIANEGGCAAFVMQNSMAMYGELLREELRNRLSYDRRGRSPNLKPYVINLADNQFPLNEFGILQRLGAEFDRSNQSEELGSLQKQLLQFIQHNLRSNTTILIEIGPWDEVTDDDQQVTLLNWLLEDFWNGITEMQAEAQKEYSRVKCILILFTYSDLPPDRSPCLIDLPLECWSEQEIQEWLEDTQGYSKTKSQQEAKKIHKQSGYGSPLAVRSLLERLLGASPMAC